MKSKPAGWTSELEVELGGGFAQSFGKKIVLEMFRTEDAITHVKIDNHALMTLNNSISSLVSQGRNPTKSCKRIIYYFTPSVL